MGKSSCGKTVTTCTPSFMGSVECKVTYGPACCGPLGPKGYQGATGPELEGTITDAVQGEFLRYDGTEWVNSGGLISSSDTVAIGENTTLGALGSVSVGINSNSGDNSVSVGDAAISTGLNSIAIGTGPTAAGANSISIGQGNDGANPNSVSITTTGLTAINTGFYIDVLGAAFGADGGVMTANNGTSGSTYNILVLGDPLGTGVDQTNRIYTMEVTLP